jgi:hypothetical protein
MSEPRPWLEWTWPAYKRLGRYRPGRRLGPAGIEWTPDHLPWPQVSVYQHGDGVSLGVSIGPLGPDPVLALWLELPRPGARKAV